METHEGASGETGKGLKNRIKLSPGEEVQVPFGKYKEDSTTDDYNKACAHAVFTCKLRAQERINAGVMKQIADAFHIPLATFQEDIEVSDFILSQTLERFGDWFNALENAEKPMTIGQFEELYAEPEDLIAAFVTAEGKQSVADFENQLMEGFSAKFGEKFGITTRTSGIITAVESDALQALQTQNPPNYSHSSTQNGAPVPTAGPARGNEGNHDLAA